MAKKTKGALAKATVSPIPVKIVSTSNKIADTPEVCKSDEARERKWKAEDALRTCKEYEKIKNDKTLMSDVKKLAKQEMDRLNKVAKKY